MAKQSNINDALENTDLTADPSMYEDDFALFSLNLKKKEKETLAAEGRIAKAKEIYIKKWYNAEKKAIEDSTKSKEQKETELAALKRRLNDETIKLARDLEDNLYKYSTLKQKAQMAQERKEAAQNHIERIKQKMAEVEIDIKNGRAIDADLKEHRENLLKAGQEAIQAETQRRKLIEATNIDSKKAFDEKREALIESFEIEKAQHKENIANIDAQLEALEEKKKLAIENGSDGSEFQEEIDTLKAAKANEQQAIKQNTKDSNIAQVMDNAMKSMTNVISNTMAKLTGGVDEAISTVGQFRSGIEARLQGSQSSYDKAADTIKGALAVSPFVKQKEVLQKLNDAVDKGIAYNVEQRAFLATVSDKIVSTFDAFDSNLMRIIRLQQADTTAARMGMEANLLQFFNNTYSDSSYLNDGYDQVSQALIDANAQMSRDMSIAFEYNVQKWMGSLASLGFGTDTIQTIATGINYLGSGNVQALAGNTQLQSLLAMSASKAGLSYSEMLVEGIDDSQVNTLLKSMVEYLKEIATDNNAVVKAAYGDVFNFSQADLRAVSNLSSADIGNIYSQNMSYSTAMSEINSQLNQIGSRLSTTEMIDNVFDNFLYTSGESIANDPISALTWKLLSTIEDATGGIHLPAVSVMGNMVDLSSFTIEGIGKTAMFGLSALGNIGNMISSIANGGGMDLGIWGGAEYTTRGGNFSPTIGGVQKSTSSSRAVSSASSSDTKKASLASTEEDQETMKKQSQESSKGEKTVSDLYKAVVYNDKAIQSYDIYLLPQVKDIKEKITTINASINTNNTHLDTIKGILSKPINVQIAGLDTMFKSIEPKDVQKVKYVEDGKDAKLSEMFNILKEAFVAALTGQDTSQYNFGDSKYTMANLAKWFMDNEGSINVSDASTQRNGDMYTLVEKIYNDIQ